MAFNLDFGFGSETSKEKTKIDQTQTVEQKKTADETTAGAVATTGLQASDELSKSIISTLDEETQGILAGLLEQIAGNFGAGPATDIANLLFSRATTGDADLQAQNQSIIESARLEGQNVLERSFTGRAAQAGSSFNTLVQAATARESGELTTKLAGLESELNLGSRDRITNELIKSLEGITAASGQPISQVASLAQVLKGATTAGETEVSGKVTSEQEQITNITNQLTELLASVSDVKGKNVSTGTASKQSFGFGF